jgi:hypothetical protein
MARGSKPGERRGGRQKGTRNHTTSERGLALSELAQKHTKEAVLTLVEIASKGISESARVTAAVAILDRGYGRPPQSLEHTGTGPDGSILFKTVYEND